MAPTHAGAGASLEADAHRLALFLDKYRYIVLLFLTAAYALGAVVHAQNKPLWFDELVTVIAASAPDAASTWKVAQAVDASPPLPHLLTHFSIEWFGRGEVAVRLPAMVGFWICCLCLYRFTRRRAGIYYALTALLLPIATNAFSYAYEARAYGLELAFGGLALLAWQMAAEGQQRVAALTLLAASLAGAIMCHYYAVLLYIPLAGAEAFRSRRARHIDWGIWAAFAASLTPVVWRAVAIAGVVQGFTRTNSASGGSLRWFLQFWESELATMGSLLVFFAALLAVSIVSRRRLGAACGQPAALEEHEIVAGLLFLAIPLAAVATAALVTHTFAFRYAELGVAGFCFLVPMLVAHFSGGRAWFGFVLLTATLACIVLARVEIVEPAHPFTGDPELARALEREPVAIADGMLFLQLWYYAPERLKSRIIYLSDNEAAQRYLKNELLENGLKGLRPWAAVRVLDYRSFATPGREFLVYQKKYYISWLLDRIVDDGGSASIEASHDFRTLVRVRIKR